MRRLDFDRLLGPGRGRQRELVKAMVAGRVLEPASKLATASALDNSTLADTFGVRGANENALYEAMDWLVEHRPNIEKRLAKRHPEPCGLVLYDLTSSYVEGTECPLATRGYSRDGKPHKLQVNFGIVTDEMGRPVAVDVYEGRTADPATVKDLDGLYVIRTSVPADAIGRDDVVRSYKRLTKVERDFRSIKASGLEVRPIFHRTEPRVRGHIFLCMLAQYVQWHMRFALRELLFAEETDATDVRDPVAPAQTSPTAKRKKARTKTEDGLPIQNFKGLLRVSVHAPA